MKKYVLGKLLEFVWFGLGWPKVSSCCNCSKRDCAIFMEVF